MAKQKKRGFFSWLGLGQQEQQTPPPDESPLTEQSAAEPTQQAVVSPDAPVSVLPATGEAIPDGTLSSDPDEPEIPPVPAPPVISPDAFATIPQPAVTESAFLPEAAKVQEIAIATEILQPTATATTTALNDDQPVHDYPTQIQPYADNPAPADISIPAQEKPGREGFFHRLKRGLLKTRQNLGSGFLNLFRGKKIDDALFEELEEQLLIADTGVETTRKIISKLTEAADHKQLQDAYALYNLLKEEMARILQPVEAPLVVSEQRPFVLLMVGVNGVGKTTTIGKLARQFQQQGKSVMLAAGDTFRAAAVEQLQAWGTRNQIPVVAQQTGADSASVIFDAMQAARARHIDILIADTAGRLQNKAHLMEELKKIVRVMKKLDDSAPHEIMLTLDASTGQNAISQTKLFHEAVGLTGISLTKLDGTAKGGVIFSLADHFAIPLRYIGMGEGIDDLRSFNASDFIEALFAKENDNDPL